MARRGIWIAALAILLVVGLLASIPARVLGLFVQPPQWVAQGYEGTIWRGSAGRVLVRVGHGYLHLGEVNWRIRPWSLLMFAPTLELDSVWGSQRISLVATVSGSHSVRLEEVEATLSAAIARNFAPLLIDGQVVLQLAHFELRDGASYRVDGQVEWRNAAWESPSGMAPLGSYLLDVAQAPGEPLAGSVGTLAGPVKAQGSLSLDGRNYEVDVALTSDEAFEPLLAQSLSLLARQVGDGYQFELRGAY